MSDEQILDQEAPEEPQVDWDAEARKTGWTPKENFKGDPAKWIDSEQWVKRGETFIPFLRASNSELKVRQNATEEALRDAQRQLAAANKAIEELKTFTTEQKVENANEDKESLISAIAAAREEGDVRKELKLRDQLDEVNEKIREAKRPQPKPAEQPPNGAWKADPVYQAWLDRNTWFGRDQERSSVALGYMNYINGNPDTQKLSPAEKYDLVSARIEKLFGAEQNPRRAAPSRVEGPRGGPGGSEGGGGRSFDDLPASAKSQCDAFSKRFVGVDNGRGEIKYKTLADYRAQYARDYFREDWGQRHQNG